jgi:hypothetical protein
LGREFHRPASNERLQAKTATVFESHLECQVGEFGNRSLRKSLIKYERLDGPPKLSVGIATKRMPPKLVVFQGFPDLGKLLFNQVDADVDSFFGEWAFGL